MHNPNKADEGDYECHANSASSPTARKRTANLTVVGTQIFYFVRFCFFEFQCLFQCTANCGISSN